MYKSYKRIKQNKIITIIYTIMHTVYAAEHDDIHYIIDNSPIKLLQHFGISFWSIILLLHAEIAMPLMENIWSYR